MSSFDDHDDQPKNPLRFRNRDLILSLLDYVYDAGEAVPWGELLTVFGIDAGRPLKTVENSLYDLLQFGALHRVGQPGTRSRPDSRAMKPTNLGRAWRDRILLPLPGELADPIEEADRIAHELEPDTNALAADVASTIGHHQEDPER